MKYLIRVYEIRENYKKEKVYDHRQSLRVEVGDVIKIHEALQLLNIKVYVICRGEDFFNVNIVFRSAILGVIDTRLNLEKDEYNKKMIGLRDQFNALPKELEIWDFGGRVRITLAKGELLAKYDPAMSHNVRAWLNFKVTLDGERLERQSFQPSDYITSSGGLQRKKFLEGFKYDVVSGHKEFAESDEGRACVVEMLQKLKEMNQARKDFRKKYGMS